MAHGYPDWGGAAPLATVYTLQDLAELAARLGSIVTFDRRGNLIYMCGFESGLIGWLTSAIGTGGAVEQSAEFSRNGAFCAKLIGGSSSPGSAQILKGLPYPVIGKLGLEFSFDLNAYVEYFYVGMMLYTGATRYYPRLRFEPDAGDIDYYDSAGGWTNLVTGASFATTKLRHVTMKLVADFENAKYCRVMHNSITYDISTADLWSFASSAGPRIDLIFFVDSDAGQNGICWLDDVILTQNEP